VGSDGKCGQQNSVCGGKKIKEIEKKEEHNNNHHSTQPTITQTDLRP